MSNRITVQLPVEGLLFWKLSGHEAMSEMFELSLTLLGSDARLDRSKLLGQPVTVTIPTQNALSSRYFNGKITRVAVSAVELSGIRYAAYQLIVEPDLWPMKRDRNLRIFQGQTVPQIINTLLSEYQVNVEDKLNGSYRVWDYCVQYQESSFAFISRLMELEGIAYHFRHEAGKHTMVLTDSATQHQPVSGYETIPYHQTASGGITTEEGIGQWALEDSVTPGIYSLDDYDFRKPNAWLFQARQNPASPSPGSIDVYDWPGRFVDHGHGEFYARIRQERWQVEHQQIQASATAVGIAPGATFTLTNAPFFSDNGEYLTTAADYLFEENSYASGGNSDISHQIHFRVIPSSVVYRPAQVTDWPRTYGPQTAKVVGPEGESIWTDRYGRIKVKFHWDRHAKGDDTSSCWVRVSSAWAGQGFGGVQIPRVGDEVVIDFINGDPDRPIVTGRVYNEASMPPWDLPGDATRMGFMTRSKDGNQDNASYLFFEDKLGEESVDLHSEKNMNVSVEGMHNEVVHQQTIYSHLNTRSTSVVGHDTQTFNAGQTIAITANGRNESIVDSETKSVTGYSSNSYTGNVVTESGDTVSTLAASKIMYETPDVIFGQVVDAKGTESAVPNIPFDIKNTAGQIMAAPGTKLYATDYLAAASTSAVSAATRVTYKKGVVTHIQGIDKLTVDNNQIVDVKGNVARNILGEFNETVQGKISINSPLKISIKSDTKVEIVSPEGLFTNKGISVSLNGTTHSFNGLSTSVNGASFSWTPLNMPTSLASIVHSPMNVTRSLTKIESSLQNVVIGFIHMFM
ncbi:TPA: type VI secretion system Vgr family protein [Klebsiella aerogenes]|jgi:type VI secretion system secreted protein VgrG|uniref:type VI secretion system Vgr family protein n=1 Tax=Klebsiella aerogenes TaxID=548 RepID=UPI000757C31B|nr:type VI secretion system tip protein TssI/VgrG [Klebsiella aerogenes]EKU0353218.1 type VI secretion system tip protein VgrG [Klebsiella aerogenes]ELA3177497.1 type VI secretion system tip protein VgrG [Klebsiella aerogenes]ELN9405192.1 type VI secretion system tip protein VgrG [Klebsiella aerogenes]ELX9631663.1 type VI secretion system tip protein VgrG [Klebsiella aerogenes]EMC2744638.1 type VI secretion system tip protein VgrG [Klebsiella aerogenes]